MGFPDYLKRLGVMLLMAMPLTVVAVALLENAIDKTRDQGFASVIGGSVVIVYFWGAFTAIAVSFAHSYAIAALGRSSAAFSMIMGAGLGLLGGAATPTFFTGFLARESILWGGFTGLTYGLLTALLFSRDQ